MSASRLCTCDSPHPSSYAPWCSVCKSIKHDVSRAAWLAYNLSLPVSVAVIHNINKESADAYGVTQIPRFFLFRNGSYEDFPLLTTGEAIVAGASLRLL